MITCALPIDIAIREGHNSPIFKERGNSTQIRADGGLLISELDFAASPRRYEQTNTRQEAHFVRRLSHEMSGEYGCSDCQPVSRGGVTGTGEADNGCGGTVACLVASIAQSRVSDILLVLPH